MTGFIMATPSQSTLILAHTHTSQKVGRKFFEVFEKYSVKLVISMQALTVLLLVAYVRHSCVLPCQQSPDVFQLTGRAVCAYRMQVPPRTTTGMTGNCLKDHPNPIPPCL